MIMDSATPLNEVAPCRHYRGACDDRYLRKLKAEHIVEIDDFSLIEREKEQRRLDVAKPSTKVGHRFGAVIADRSLRPVAPVIHLGHLSARR